MDVLLNMLGRRHLFLLDGEGGGGAGGAGAAGSEGGAAGDAGNAQQGDAAGGAGTATAERGEDAWPDEAKDLIRKLRKESRDRDKAAREFEGRLKTFEDRDKTEQQRAAERAEAAEARAAELELALLRRDVAAKLNLPPALAARLQGKDEDEMTEDAKALIAGLGLEGGGSGRLPGATSGGTPRQSGTGPNAAVNDALRQGFGRGRR
jgi:hypothetical protein